MLFCGVSFYFGSPFKIYYKERNMSESKIVSSDKADIFQREAVIIKCTAKKGDEELEITFSVPSNFCPSYLVLLAQSDLSGGLVEINIYEVTRVINEDKGEFETSETGLLSQDTRMGIGLNILRIPPILESGKKYMIRLIAFGEKKRNLTFILLDSNPPDQKP